MQGIPPVAVRVVEYGAFWVAFGTDVVVTTIGGTDGGACVCMATPDPVILTGPVIDTWAHAQIDAKRRIKDLSMGLASRRSPGVVDNYKAYSSRSGSRIESDDNGGGRSSIECASRASLGRADSGCAGCHCRLRATEFGCGSSNAYREVNRRGNGCRDAVENGIYYCIGGQAG